MQDRYILLTAAKNEGDYIGETIASVLRQSIRPVAWFIMDDGSTDQTAKIVETFAREHPFIKLQSAGSLEGRNFGSQYKAIQAAFERAKPLNFDFVGVHDADISPQSNQYYQGILEKFDADRQLGIAGGYIYERQAGEWASRKSNSPDSVAGGIQMFRRACFETIKGYTPLTHGGSDWLAQLDARIAGYNVLACPEYPVFHYRPTSSAGGIFRGLFRAGMMDASFGSHPLFELFKCARRIKVRPFFFGSVARLFGFAWWNLKIRRPLIPLEKAAFLRQTQKEKILQWFKLGSSQPSVASAKRELRSES